MEKGGQSKRERENQRLGGREKVRFLGMGIRNEEGTAGSWMDYLLGKIGEGKKT